MTGLKRTTKIEKELWSTLSNLSYNVVDVKVFVHLLPYANSNKFCHTNSLSVDFFRKIKEGQGKIRLEGVDFGLYFGYLL